MDARAIKIEKRISSWRFLDEDGARAALAGGIEPSEPHHGSMWSVIPTAQSRLADSIAEVVEELSRSSALPLVSVPQETLLHLACSPIDKAPLRMEVKKGGWAGVLGAPERAFVVAFLFNRSADDDRSHAALKGIGRCQGVRVGRPGGLLALPWTKVGQVEASVALCDLWEFAANGGMATAFAAEEARQIKAEMARVGAQKEARGRQAELDDVRRESRRL